MSLVATRARYVPDVSAWMALCSANYYRIMRLLPEKLTVGTCYSFGAGQDLHYRICVEEVTKYTVFVRFEQLINPSIARVAAPCAAVRIYHDAQVAEVCSSQQISYFKPTYTYPNDKMHQRDEKFRINAFLAEWLRFCLDHGYSLEELS